MKESIKKPIFRIFDLVSAPFIYLVLPVLREIRRHGVHNFPFNRKNFLSVGVFPIRNHYYEPQIGYSKDFDANKIRNLRLDFNLEKQLAALSALRHSEELAKFPLYGDHRGDAFYVNNPAFGPGDSDLYYLLIRNIQPK